MELILVKAPETPEEQIFRLKPGNNTLGSGQATDLTIPSKTILQHHFNIENANHSLVISTVLTVPAFMFGGKYCRRAVIRPGDHFSLENIPFYCRSSDVSEKTQHAMFVSSYRAAATSPIPTRNSQISGFILQ